MNLDNKRYHIKPYLKAKGYNLSSIATSLGMSFQRFDHHIKIREDLSYNFILNISKIVGVKVDTFIKEITIENEPID